MEEKQTGFFAWLQDNARILLSVALVLFLLFAVYSYSKRTDRNATIVTDGGTEEVMSTNEDGDDIKEDALTADIKEMLDSSDKIVGNETDTEGTEAQGNNEAEGNEKMAKEVAKPKVVIERKDGAVTVTAQNGDGLTHLARKAAADFAANVKTGNLSAEQNVYVEDYLRKSVAQHQVFPGTQVSFTNDMIATAVEKAHALSDAEIRNLSKYVR